MRIMAVDTATEACSVALWDNGSYSVYFEECHREHSQRVLPLVQEILSKGNLTLTDLNALAFSRGPGSLTGIRIGISITQGLALGASLPMIGISTLASMAQGAFRRTGVNRVLVAMDARMGEIYWAEYIRNELGVWYGEETEVVCKPLEINARLKTLSGKWVMVGTGWTAWPELVQDNSLTLVDGNMLLSSAEDMLPIACKLLVARKTVAVQYAEPVYLRKELAWKKLPGRK